MTAKKSAPTPVATPRSEYPWPLRLANALDDAHLLTRRKLAKWLRKLARYVAP